MSSSSSATQPVLKAGGVQRPATRPGPRIHAYFLWLRLGVTPAEKKLISKVMNGNNRAQGSCINLRNNQTFQASTEFRLFSTE
jgi:hypothetical protein